MGRPVVMIMSSLTKNVPGWQLTLTQPDKSLPLKRGLKPALFSPPAPVRPRLKQKQMRDARMIRIAVSGWRNCKFGARVTLLSMGPGREGRLNSPSRRADHALALTRPEWDNRC